MLSSPLNKQTVDRFLLVLDTPPALRHLKTKNARTNQLLNSNSMQFTVYGSVIPSITVPYLTERLAGQSISVSTHNKQAPDPISVRFNVDNNFNNYWFIYKWLDFISDDVHGIYDGKNISRGVAGMPGIGYQTNLTVYALDEYQKAKTIKFTYTNAFPVYLSGIDWSYQDSKAMAGEFRFMYSQFRAELLCDTEFESVLDPTSNNSVQICS